MGFFSRLNDPLDTKSGGVRKEIKNTSRLRGLDTGARVHDEARKEKNQRQVDKHAEKLQRKNGWGLW